MVPWVSDPATNLLMCVNPSRKKTSTIRVRRSSRTKQLKKRVAILPIKNLACHRIGEPNQKKINLTWKKKVTSRISVACDLGNLLKTTFG